MVASAAIGALGSIAANVIGGFASNANAMSQQKALADYQAVLNWKYAKKNALKMPTYNRLGIERAGYNPMLALGNIGASNSQWTTTGNPTNADFSTIGSNAVDTLNSIQAQDNQNMQTVAQVDNYNADTMLKNNQAITELYSQLEKLNHADLEQAQATLTKKDISWYDKKQAREDIRVANEIERTGNDFKVGMANALAGQMQGQAALQNASSNAQDVKNRYDLGKNTKTYSYSGSGLGFSGSESITGYGVNKQSLDFRNRKGNSNYNYKRNDYYNHNKTRHFNDPYGIGGYYD